jgi:hypothetical protein
LRDLATAAFGDFADSNREDATSGVRYNYNASSVPSACGLKPTAISTAQSS